jgi:hypothetical protein
MPARRRWPLTAILDEYLPMPARLLLTLVALMLGLCVAGLTWPPLPDATPSTAAVVVITPDDPAAATPTPAAELGR